MKAEIWSFAMLAIAFGCQPSAHVPDSQSPVPAVAAPVLPTKPASVPDVVNRDAIVFTPPTPPAQLIDAMASRRVAILGEVHLLQEHHDFVMATLEALHARGTRLLLLESFHAHGHRSNSFVLGQTDKLSPETERYFGGLLGKLRRFNEGLSPEQRVHVAFIDINHVPWALPGALALDQAEHDATTPQRVFLSTIGWDWTKPYQAQRQAFEERWQADPQPLRAALEALQAQLVADTDAWLRESCAVALESLKIKTIWSEQGEHVAHPLREDVIKRLVDAHVLEAEGTILINIGGYHAQRKHVMGTPKQWLAEHLAQPGGASQGSVYAVYVNVAHAEQRVGSEVRTLSIRDEPDALMTLLAELARTEAAYLPLTDPVFGNTMLGVHYLYNIVEHRPAEQFDAYVLLPRGTLLPGFGASAL